MAKPKFRIEITPKDASSKPLEIAALWPATRKDQTPIVFKDGTTPFNIRLGNNSRDNEAEVYFVVIPKGGQKYKVSLDTHFISLLENTERKSEPEGSDSAPNDEDF